ncbi:serine/threonine-protein kinase NIM1 [Gadus chalcogrammus]|uniref:serine/threonine-protein kinase NIM1 n=1 Tax=Gadus chalcogrammus TaxID=1042646 RepID=UPI0024C27754|nr:serine/threonine-protein kinase NIM1 [Gadus chalcogrammus]
MAGGQYQVAPPGRGPSLCSLTDGSDVGPEEGDPDDGPHSNPLKRLTSCMRTDEKVMKELIIGRRVGFYKVRGEIGCGSFSRVKLAFHALTKDKVALKILDKTRMDVQAQRQLAREIANTERLQHPNVVRLYEVVETPCRLYLVLEYAGGGDLHTRICDRGKMAADCCKVAFAQILFAIKYLHNNMIIHRDLKAENVLFTARGCVKVADFGFSTRVPGPDRALDTFCGSPPYAAPELFRDESYLGPPVDVWALGVLLFFMATATMPFRADTLGKLRRCVLDGAYAVPPWVPGPCQRLIKGMLRPLPEDRHAVDQMLGCDWLLPVEFPWPLLGPVPPGWTDREEEEEVEEEVRAGLEELGFTREHAGTQQGPPQNSRSPVTGAYRILLHRTQRRRGCETVPVVRGMVRDPRREGLKAYRGLRHSSKLCVVS